MSIMYKKILVSEIKYVKRTGEMPSPAALSTLSRFILLLFLFKLEHEENAE